MGEGAFEHRMCVENVKKKMSINLIELLHCNYIL